MAVIRTGGSSDGGRALGPGGRRASGSHADPWLDDAGNLPQAPSRINGHRFNAELDVAEIDDRSRPGLAWSARGRELSCSQLVLLSRRMVHVGRLLLVAVHLIDDRPTPLFGKVAECEYESEGMHRIVLDFLPMPESESLRSWVEARRRS
jgi:hypothetical protein